MQRRVKFNHCKLVRRIPRNTQRLAAHYTVDNNLFVSSELFFNNIYARLGVLICSCYTCGIVHGVAIKWERAKNIIGDTRSN